MKNFLNKATENNTGVRTDDTIFCADIGTSSLKAALIRSDGKVIAFSKQNFAQHSSKKISMQWLNAFAVAANQFAEKINSVKGICISGNGPTIVSDDGTTLLWNDKTDEKAGCEEGKNTKSLFIPRLLAFRQKFCSEWKNARFIFSGPEFLYYLLTEKAVTVLPEKRYKTAYWSHEELLRCGITDDEQKKLPPFVPPAFNCGYTTEKITELLSLPSPVPVLCGVPDFVAALIGTNTLKPGKICDRAGSSEGLNLCIDNETKNNFPPNPEIRILPSVIPELWNASFLIPDSGRLFSDYKAKIEQESGKKTEYNFLVEECLADKTGDGFTIMKILAEKNKRGIEILQKALNSSVSNGTEKDSKKSGAANTIEAITITGGQAKSEKWIQIKADICKINFELTSLADSELSGDAVLGFTGLGVYKSIQEAADSIVKTGKIFVPQNQQNFTASPNSDSLDLKSPDSVAEKK